MTFDVAFAYLLLFGAHILFLRRFVLKDLSSGSKALLIVLYTLHALLIGLFYASRQWGHIWSWYFDYRFGEYNPSAAYAAAVFMLVALAGMAVAWRGASLRLWQRLYWLGTGLFFGYLGLDEYFVLHEGTKNWTLMYAAVAGLLALSSAAYYWFGGRREQRVFLMIVGGLGVAAAGGAGLELLAARDCFGYLGQTCNRLPLIEEALENVGILTTLLGVLLYAEGHVAPPRWPRVYRVVLAGGFCSALVFLGGSWIVPDLEAQWFAQPVSIEYFDNRLSILAYRVDQQVLHPGGTLDLSVYWRVNDEVFNVYGLSAHLISRVDGQSFASEDRLVDEPKFAQAVHGVVHRTNMTLKLPPDIPAQASYWLTLTTWEDRRPEFVMQPIGFTDRSLVTPDMAVLQSISVIDPAPDITVEHPARFDFGPDVALTGYTAQVQDRHLMLQFAWENRAPMTQRRVQFLHLFDADGAYVLGFDQPPFAGDFPTTDWPPDLRARAEWQIDLPPDLSPGEYYLRTGLYDMDTHERVPVTDSEGIPLQDFIIELGTIFINS